MKNSVKKEQVITSEILFGKSLKLKNMKKVLERWARNRQKLERWHFQNIDILNRFDSMIEICKISFKSTNPQGKVNTQQK